MKQKSPWLARTFSACRQRALRILDRGRQALWISTDHLLVAVPGDCLTERVGVYCAKWPISSGKSEPLLRKLDSDARPLRPLSRWASG